MSGPGKIAASVLTADFARLGQEVQDLAAAGVDRIQWDVMDGHFVPNLTLGPDIIASTRGLTSVTFEAHLMVKRPDDLLPLYVEAGCEFVIVHAEEATHLHRTLESIRDLGARSGVALNPATPLSAINHVLQCCDLVLVMTVNPGFGGQSYIREMEGKVLEARRLIDEQGLSCDLEVDGGISPQTISGAANAGADVFVVGSALFNHPGGKPGAVKALRDALGSTVGAGIRHLGE